MYVVVIPLLTCFSFATYPSPLPRKTDQTHEDKKDGQGRAKKEGQKQLVNAATDNNT